jgi:SAM-dependent methyltransferase
MSRCLDLGCGIGRHLIYLDDMGFDAYGIDISDKAINYARALCKNLNKEHLIDKVTVGSIVNMPYSEEFFDFIISHGVLDSMPFALAKEAIQEIYRIMKASGLLYFDVISGDDYKHCREYDGEEIVEEQHEKGTIQSYFNWSKINSLLGDKFRIIEALLIQRESVITRNKNSRYHIIAEKIL